MPVWLAACRAVMALRVGQFGGRMIAQRFLARLGLAGVLAAALWLTPGAGPRQGKVEASGQVGAGTPESCTEA